MLKHQKVNQDPELTDRLVRKQMRQQLRKAIKAETKETQDLLDKCELILA